MNVSRQIGWSQESNLLYQILKQITKLTAVVFGLKPKYKVFTALSTQAGPNSVVVLTSGELIIGTTYRIKSYVEGDDFTNVGAPNNNVDTYFIATGTTPTNWTNSSELNYNEGAPTVIVLENTIGNVWFQFNADGNYLALSDGLFTLGKTFVIIGDLSTSFSSDPFGKAIFNNSTEYEGQCEITTSDSTNTLINSQLYSTPIRIEVYN